MLKDPADDFRIISHKNETLLIFSNLFLEKLTHVSPRSLICVYLPAVIYFLFISVKHQGAYPSLITFMVGILFWTFLEYMMHRFVFHHRAKSKIGKKFFFLIHGIHHAYPQDMKRLATPAIVSLPFAILFSIIYAYLFGKYSSGLFAGTLFAYLLYDLGHYALHRYHPKNPVLKYLKRYHFAHHYFDNKKYFGVSTPLWDYIIGTYSPIGKKSTITHDEIS